MQIEPRGSRRRGDTGAKQPHRWPGMVPLARTFLFGQRAPQAGELPTGQETSTSYEGMDPAYRWFRQDRLVRRCILSNAYWSTLAAGFEITLEPTDPSLKPGDEGWVKAIDDNAFLKQRLDKANKDTNMDMSLFRAQLNRSIYGRAAYEILLGADKLPERLIPLEPKKIRPKIDSKTWELKGYTYGRNRTPYRVDEVLYLPNLALEAGMMGISDIEPVLDACTSRHEIIQEDVPEITKTLWAPFTILQADTTGMTDENETTFLEALTRQARSGKAMAVNRAITAASVNLSADISGLVALLEALKTEIVGNFGTPRFLLGQPIENRATAYAELEAYIDGTIKSNQRDLRRLYEEQWIDRYTPVIYEAEGLRATPEKPLPVKAKLRFNRIRSVDIIDMSAAVANIWQTGMGPFPDNREKLWELMGWPAEEFNDGRQKPPAA